MVIHEVPRADLELAREIVGRHDLAPAP